MKDEEEYAGNDDFKRSPDYGISEEEGSVEQMMAKYLDVDTKGIDSNPEGDTDIFDTIDDNLQGQTLSSLAKKVKLDEDEFSKRVKPT
jgi:hypothetical protein